MSIKKPRGLIDYLLLNLIKQKDSYGYELIKKIKDISGGYWDPSYGTIYGALSRLEKNNYIKRAEKEHEDRKYFTMTKKGEKRLKNYSSNKEELRKKYEEIILGLMNVYKELNGEKNLKKLLKKTKKEFKDTKK